MVFWSRYIKKLKTSVSKIDFLNLEKKVDKNVVDINTNKNGIDANKNNIDTNRQNIENNFTQIEINKTDIATNKTDIATNKTEIGINSFNINSLVKQKAEKDEVVPMVLKALFPVGSIVMTVDGTEHNLVKLYPNNFEEIREREFTYLALSQQPGIFGTNFFTLEQRHLPKINLPHTHNTSDINDYGTLEAWNFGTGGSVWNGITKRIHQSDNGNLNLNPGPQAPINIGPRALGIRLWKVIKQF